MPKKPKAASAENDDHLNALVAERVMGWKDVKPAGSGGEYEGQRPDKLGRWRRGKVPSYSSDLAEAAAIPERMKELGLYNRYEKELARIARAKGVPPDWAGPENISRAALKAVPARRPPGKNS